MATSLEARVPFIDHELVQFSFQEILSGHYGIRVFIDTNGNGRLDRGLLGPREPWGMSWQEKRIFGIPNFEDVAFHLDGDIHDIEIDSRRE